MPASQGSDLEKGLDNDSRLSPLSTGGKAPETKWGSSMLSGSERIIL